MAEAEIVVDVEASPLSESMKVQLKFQKKKMQRKLNTLWGDTNEVMNFTIFRTPHNISESQKNLFEPSVISIGPFHRGQKHLQALEEQKWRFLQDFLSRGDHISLDRCISEMILLEERTRRCYSEMVDLESVAFVEMMLLDGCFVLEYFLKKMEQNWNSILEVGWNSNFIPGDLLLLENQIPFFIVMKLHDIGLNDEEDRKDFIKYLARNFLARALTNNPTNSIIPDPPKEIHHLVHLCYHCVVPNPEEPVVLSSKSCFLTIMFSANRIKGFLHWFLSTVLRRRSTHSTSRSLSVPFPNISSMVIPSATELKQKGLKFTPENNQKHMLDVSFEYGVLKIPRLAITDSTKPIFANLIAFEQSNYAKKNSPFTTFLAFLNNLVNTQNDVTILQQNGIIENWLGNEEELTQFINQVTEGGSIGKDHYLAGLYREVNRYSESTWNRQRAIFFRDYFSNPWAAISLIAAFILLVLTLVQSFFAVFTYFHPPATAPAPAPR